MIEKIFPRAFMRRRMAASHLGIILFDFALYLRDNGYALRSLHQHLAIAEHFSRWMSAGSLRVSDLDEAVVERFLQFSLTQVPMFKTSTQIKDALPLRLTSAVVVSSTTPRAPVQASGEALWL